MDGVKQVREGRCMQRENCWTAVWAPISLATCAGILRDAAFEPAINDCITENLDFEAVKKIASAFKPSLVVVNVVTPAIESDVRAADEVKAVCPNAKVAVLGIHPTALPEHCFQLSEALDVAVRAEPEYTVRDLAVTIREGGDFSDIPGISFKSDGAVVHNADRPFIRNLDELAFPAWDLLDTNNYRMPFTRNKFLLVGTGRGCPYPCTFCADKAYYGRKLRLRSPESIVDELERNKREFDVHEALFWSESFTINQEFATAVAEEILRRKVEVRWVCNSRVDNVTMEFLTKAKRAGLDLIGFGIESGVQEVLDSINKRATLEQAVEAVRMCKEVGVAVVAHVVLGFPGETVQTLTQTIEFVKDLKVDFAQFYCAVPFPGSQLYKEAREKGYIVTDDWSRFEQNFSVISTPTLSAEEVMALRRKAYRSFYLSPHSIFTVLKRLKTLRDVRNFAKMAFDFLKWL